MLYKCIKHRVFLTRLLVIVYIFSMTITFESKASQSSMLGTIDALGSPLTSNTFTVENWNVWEMLCFGIFLSNFCQPFEDDYASAFTEGASVGTKGRGLKALQFAAGGDATSSGYLADMVNYCKEAQAQSYKKIYVNYGYYEYNESVSTESGALRAAYIDDLFPVLLNWAEEADKEQLRIASNALITSPAVAYNVHEMDGFGNNLTYAEAAILPTFYATNSKSSNQIIFDMTENWDIQVLKALFIKMFNKHAASDFVAAEGETLNMAASLDDTFKKYLGQKCPLVMDTFGNICMVSGGRNIIVIPASTNQHLTKNNSYNYVNSFIMNNYVLSGSDTEGKMVAYGESPETIRKWLGNDEISIGNFPFGHTSEVSDGRLLVTSDSDTVLYENLYKELRKGDKTTVSYGYDTTVGNGVWEMKYTNHGTFPYTSEDGYKYGELFTNLLDSKSFTNQALQLHVTGASCRVTEKKWWFGGDARNAEDITVNTTLGAYGILSTMFALTAEGKDTLDYIYSYESSTKLSETKVPLFDGDYYLTPDIASSKGGNKLYVNYMMQMLEGNSKSVSIDTSFQSIWNDNYRKHLYDNIRAQDSAAFTWFTMLSKDIENLQNNEYAANVLYKSFISKYWKKASNYDSVRFMAEDLIVEGAKGMFDETSATVTGINMDHIPFLGEGWDGIPTRLVKVYKPSSVFSTITSLFGLDESCQFEMYSTAIYVSYLDFYGLLGGKNNHSFNDELFKEGSFKTFTGDSFKNGMTKEQMEDQVKLNTFKLLSLSKEGEEYRSSLFKSIIKTWIVEPLDDNLNKGGIGNVGAETRFLDIKKIEDNALVGNLVKNYWGIASIVIFGALSIIAIVSGALNNKTIGWYLSILVASSTLVYAIPVYVNIPVVLIEKYVNSHFRNTGAYWALAESVNYDKNKRDLAASTESGVKAQALLNTLGFLDTDSSLMVKLDISQKVISVSALDYEQLQQMTTTRWLLPSLMQQMSQTTDNFDYVSVPVTRLYNNYASMWIMYHGESDYMNVTKEGKAAGDIAEQVSVMSLADKQGLWQGSNEMGYKSTAPATYGASNSTKSVSRVLESEGEPSHTCFYLLNNLKIVSAFDNMSSNAMTRDEWRAYARKVAAHASGEDCGVSSGTFQASANEILSTLNSWNTYQNPAQQSFGYLWTTENLGTYFYLLAKESLGESANPGKNVAYVVMQLQGDTAEGANGEAVRTSFMHYKDTGWERDVCDMEEVFTNVIPYMYQMMILANGTSNKTGLLGSAKMTGNPYYNDNYLSWMFRCNWVTKLYEDNLYAGTATMVARDAEGNSLGKVTVENMCNPRCYPEERPMVFSEAQMHEMHLTKEDLNFVERKILDFNTEVVRRWTTLINYANTDGLDKEDLYREMAMDALFAFNSTFTRDNIIMTEKTMYPVNFDLRKISLITILRSLVCNMTSSANYMYGGMAVTLYETYGFMFGYVPLLLLYLCFLLFGLVRDLALLIMFVTALVTLWFNFMTTSENKFKSMGGCIITATLFTGVTIFYYFIVNMMVGNPTVDTLVNFSTISSTGLSTLPFWGSVLLVILLTGGYIWLLCAYYYELYRGHKFGLSVKDGGFGFYLQVARNAQSAIVGATERMGNKLHSGLERASKFGPGASSSSGGGTSKSSENNTSNAETVTTKTKGGNITIQNTEANPVPVTVTKDKGRGKNSDFAQGSMDINDIYTSSNVTAGEDSTLTRDINEHINNSKKQASYENASNVENEGSNSSNINREFVDAMNGLQQQQEDSVDAMMQQEINKRINNSK